MSLGDKWLQVFPNGSLRFGQHIWSKHLDVISLMYFCCCKSCFLEGVYSAAIAIARGPVAQGSSDVLSLASVLLLKLLIFLMLLPLSLWCCCWWCWWWLAACGLGANAQVRPLSLYAPGFQLQLFDFEGRIEIAWNCSVWIVVSHDIQGRLHPRSRESQQWCVGHQPRPVGLGWLGDTGTECHEACRLSSQSLGLSAEGTWGRRIATQDGRKSEIKGQNAHVAFSHSFIRLEGEGHKKCNTLPSDLVDVLLRTLLGIMRCWSLGSSIVLVTIEIKKIATVSWEALTWALILGDEGLVCFVFFSRFLIFYNDMFVVHHAPRNPMAHVHWGFVDQVRGMPFASMAVPWRQD